MSETRPDIATEVQRVAAAGGELELHFVYASQWPRLGIAFELGDERAGKLWSGVRPLYLRYLSGLAFCTSCEKQLRAAFTTVVTTDRAGRAVTSFPLCGAYSRYPDETRRNAAQVLRKAAGGDAQPARDAAPGPSRWNGRGGGGRVARKGRSA